MYVCIHYVCMYACICMQYTWEKGTNGSIRLIKHVACMHSYINLYGNSAVVVTCTCTHVYDWDNPVFEGTSAVPSAREIQKDMYMLQCANLFKCVPVSTRIIPCPLSANVL